MQKNKNVSHPATNNLPAVASVLDVVSLNLPFRTLHFPDTFGQASALNPQGATFPACKIEVKVLTHLSRETLILFPCQNAQSECILFACDANVLVILSTQCYSFKKQSKKNKMEEREKTFQCSVSNHEGAKIQEQFHQNYLQSRGEFIQGDGEACQVVSCWKLGRPAPLPKPMGFR